MIWPSFRFFSVALQALLTWCWTLLRKIGLEINITKCISFKIDIDGKKKRWIWNSESYLSIEEDLIPALNTADTYKYLGVGFGLRKDFDELLRSFRAKLEIVRMAPLCSQQKLWAVKNKIIPSTYHVLSLSGFTHKLLKQVDVAYRRILRRILHLPKDTPASAFHSAVRDGGLGVL